jgi:hypothetical protein
VIGVSRIYLEYLGDCVELPPGETLVGRDVGCALRFNDSTVSRRHLRFIRRLDEVFVEDLGSSNGTLLNERRILRAMRIADGDIVRIGSRALTIKMVDSATEEQPTLVLKDLSKPAPKARPGGVPVSREPTTTMPIPLVTHQKCPQCGANVSEVDDECEGCGYKWGDFRPRSRTDVGVSSISSRRHERHDVELHVVYASAELEIETMTRNVSNSGVFVRSQVLDPVGTKCQLTILVDGGPPLKVSGIVRRVVEYDAKSRDPVGLGVEFVAITEEQRQWLDVVVGRMVDAQMMDAQLDNALDDGTVV